MNLIEILKQCSEKYPRDAAIVDLGRGGKEQRTLTFRELDEHSAQVAGMLERSGLAPGNRVLLLRPMSAGLYISLLGVLRAGLTAMFIDPSAGMTAFRTQCRRYPPAALIATPKARLLQIVCREIRAIPQKFTVGTAFSARQLLTSTRNHSDPLMEPISRENADPALLTFTSGSTGTPKPAARTHGFLHAQYRALRDNILLSPGEVDLTTLPLFLLANLAAGVTSVIPNVNLRAPGKVAPEIIVANIRQYAVTRSAASPALFERVADHCLAKGITLPTLQKIFTGGAPVFPRVLEKLQKVAPNARVFAVYGSTEAEPIAHFAAEGWDEATRAITAKGGGLCTGTPVAQIQLRLIGDQSGMPLGPMTAADFAAMEVSQGQAGEIVVAGEHVLQGYLEGLGDEETKIRVDDTIWHRTGDAGWMDAQGRVWMLGRCSAKLPTHVAPPGLPNHALCYPFTIECALREQFPDFRTAAIEWNGQRCLAIAIPISDIRREAMEEAAETLGIQRCICLRELPMDRRHNAKIDYPTLKAMIAAQADSPNA